MATWWIVLSGVIIAGALVLGLGLGARQRRVFEGKLDELRFPYDPTSSDDPIDDYQGSADSPGVFVPDELVAACLNGDCLLFAGGGLAAQAGLPTWRELLAQIIRLHTGEDPSGWQGLGERVASTPNEMAEIVASRLGQKRLIADVDQREKPLLLNPYRESADGVLCFGDQGIVGIVDGNDRGDATVKVYRLDREDLETERFRAQNSAWMEWLYALGAGDDAQANVERFRRRWESGSEPYALAALDYVALKMKEFSPLARTG